MAVKIRLKRMGKIRAPFYRVVVMDSRTKRDGRAIEEIGKYHPTEEPSVIEIDGERAQYWLSKGAQPTESVAALLKITGDWQKAKGLEGTEGTLRTKSEKTSKKDLYEAAVLDGATRVRQFFSVTIPMLRPTIIFVVITSTIGGLQIFDEPRLFDQTGQGGPSRQWMTATMYIYELGWGNQKSFGRASAAAWILFLIIIVIAMINFTATRKISSETSATKKRKKVSR